ncbi:rho gtpase-activating protein 8 [Moniliophthora roreri]|nr:rho gtpase-activating protein 8 [Moniliophthora roreri]
MASPSSSNNSRPTLSHLRHPLLSITMLSPSDTPPVPKESRFSPNFCFTVVIEMRRRWSKSGYLEFLGCRRVSYRTQDKLLPTLTERRGGTRLSVPWTELGWGKRVEVWLGGSASIRCDCMSSTHRNSIVLFSLAGAIMSGLPKKPRTRKDNHARRMVSNAFGAPLEDKLDYEGEK